MASEYWMVANYDASTGARLYLTTEGRWTPDRISARRYRLRANAKTDKRVCDRIVYVRIRGGKGMKQSKKAGIIMPPVQVRVKVPFPGTSGGKAGAWPNDVVLGSRRRLRSHSRGQP